MKVRESNSKIWGFKGLYGDPLSFRKGRTRLYWSEYGQVCLPCKSLLEWQNAIILLKMKKMKTEIICSLLKLSLVNLVIHGYQDNELKQSTVLVQ